ncbi:activator-dependent family glycosyltransferase [Marinitenerispora sediminis]|uniref:Glycosyl transferase family 28 n=1 Tax=Marinitenerispora sediminis TaxID=1931232 RepID=A0A368SY92_9ACTN|nr:activator-dependent family glycosyltransferase [Marinitenerispora sediminis]RCV47600.1 glycosyl transferase family 28 [Marinitenerispora sediminis]RCV48077.1 glycosyl transferase family 28 [Marinitenerispora sediminis]RCV48920.1 glycosyl transferase family 28 [Marinitenerispora sediminis]
MRVLFTTFAEKSHLFPQVPMAWALHTAGHDVRVASQPDLADAITSTGLTAVSVGEPLNLSEAMEEVNEGLGEDADLADAETNAGLDMNELRPERLTWDYVLGVFTAMTAAVFQNSSPEPTMDSLVEFAREWRPDLVVWDTMTFAGPVVAQATGAAHARLLFGLDLLGRMRATFLDLLARRPPELRDDPLREWLTWSAERYGTHFTEEMVTGQWTIDPVPTSLRLPVEHLRYVPVRYVPYNGRAAVPAWLHEPPKRRRVCLTLGIAHREVMGADRASIGDLLDAVADVDAEVVATLNAKQLAALGHVPDNVRVVDFVPLNALLPTCAAIVHHGGSGSFSTALAHGVPQLVLPDMVWDSGHKAQRLADAGAGLVISDGRGVTPGHLRAQLLRLLDEPSFADSAARLRREALGTPAPNDIVPLLERLTAAHRAPRP